MANKKDNGAKKKLVIGEKTTAAKSKGEESSIDYECKVCKEKLPITLEAGREHTKKCQAEHDKKEAEARAKAARAQEDGNTGGNPKGRGGKGKKGSGGKA